MTAFESPFVVDGVDRWYAKSMVRVREAEPDEVPWHDGYSLYNQDLTPHTAHPLVVGLGPRAVLELGAARLADYLAKTETVELEIVNRAVEGILRLPSTSEGMREDLLKVYTDEGYHVLMMVEFRRRIEQATSVRLDRRPNREVDEIAKLIRSCPPEKRALAVMCCAIVTETLITATLRQAGGDTVYPAVTRMLAEHATDEARHHAFFHRFAEAYLPTVVGPDRSLIEKVFRHVLWLFLCPDFSQLRDDLVAQGLTEAQARRVLSESFDPQALRQQFLSASLACRRLISGLGLEAGDVFADQLTRIGDASLLDLTTLER